MSRIIGNVALAVLLVGLYGLQSAPAAADDLNSVWTDSGVDRDLLNRYSHEIYPCPASEANFLGCVHMINGLGDNLQPAEFLLPANIKSLFPNMRMRTLNQYGPLILARVEVWADDAPASKRELSELEMKQETLLRQAVHEAYAQRVDIPFDQLADDLLARAPADMAPERVLAKAINHLIAVHDGHGRIDTLAHVQDIGSDGGHANFGIGVMIQQVGRVFVLKDIIGGSAADRAGLMVNDILVRIDGQEVTGQSLDDVISRLRGGRDTQVALQIKRRGQVMAREFLVNREPQTTNVTVKTVDDFGKRYLVIRIRRFVDDHLFDRVNEILTHLEPGIAGIILDLRGNSGGDRDQAKAIGGLFLGQRPIFLIRQLNHGAVLPTAYPQKGLTDAVTQLPLAVLINSGSASASEMVAGAIQDYKRGWLIGERSYGKATEQKGQMLKGYPKVMEFVTDFRFYQPLDHTNQIVGLNPDFEAFPTPDSSPDERFQPREENEVPSALPPLGPPWISSLHERAQEIKASCLDVRHQSRDLYQHRLHKEESADYPLLLAQEVLQCPGGVESLITSSPDSSRQEAASPNSLSQRLKAANAAIPQPMAELVEWLKTSGYNIPEDYVAPKVRVVAPEEVGANCGDGGCDMQIRDGELKVTIERKDDLIENKQILGEMLLHLIRDIQVHRYPDNNSCAFWHQENIEAVILQSRFLAGRNLQRLHVQTLPMASCQ